MKVLVTGGAGFIGSHLTAALVAGGYKVRVLDDLSSGKRENLAGLPVALQVGDVADMDSVETAVSGCDLIFHQAAFVSAPRSIIEPQLNHRSNVTGTFNLFEAARRAGVRRVVYASSAAVYGNLPGLPKQETDDLQLVTPYAASKRIAELMADNYNEAYGMEIVGLRYMNVFGPRQDPSSPYSGVLSIFCQAAVAGSGVSIHGDGEQTRDFVYVADVVRANILAATIPGNRLSAASVFNVGRGEQTSLNHIIAMLSHFVQWPIPVTNGPDRQNDIKQSFADISLAQEVLGFRPETAVMDGLNLTLNWFRENNSRSSS